MKARLSDIAQHADVSEATVSRVLNGKPGVAEATRQAVLTSLDVLGYDRPSRLRRKSAGLVGLVTPELTNPIFPAFAQVIETALARSGYTPVLCTQTPGGVHEDDYVQMLLDRSVAGIIYVSGLHANTTTDPNRYVTLRDRGLPIVLVNGYIDGVDAPFISNDDVASMDLSIGPPGPARAHQHRAGRRAGPLRAGHPQDRRVPQRDDDDARARGRRGPHPAHDVHRRGWCRGRQPPDRQGCDGDRLWLGPDGAGRDPGRPAAWSRGAPRPVRGGVRRLDPHRVHRPAAHDRAAERPGDGGGGGARAHRRDLGRACAPRGVRLPARAGRPQLHRRRAARRADVRRGGLRPCCRRAARLAPQPGAARLAPHAGPCTAIRPSEAGSGPRRTAAAWPPRPRRRRPARPRPCHRRRP